MEFRESKHVKSYSKDFSNYGQVLVIQISPFVLSQDLMLVGFEKKILLIHLKVEEFIDDLEVLAEFAQECRSTALSISPETSIKILPNIITFAAAGVDYNVSVFESNLRGTDTCKILSGHNSYINDVKFDLDGNFIASVSDDHSVRLWSTENYECIGLIHLSSPGVTVCWHKEDPSKLLVAEKLGLIRIYNVESQTPILSLDFGKSLSSADWAPSDSQLIVSLQIGELLSWHLSKPCVPLNNNMVFSEIGGHVKISPFGELIAAVHGLDGCLKVANVQNNQIKLSVPVTLPSNISWHSRRPIVCVGSYTKLKFWNVTAK